MSEARAAFIAALRAGLRGAPAHLVDEAVAEYAAHFEEGARAGRSDEDVARSLGDPLELADELAVQFRIEDWEKRASPRNGWQLFGTAMSRLAHSVAVRVLLMFALLVGAMLTLVALLCVVAGIWMLFAAPSLDLPGGDVVGWLAAAGLIFAAVACVSLLMLLGRSLVDWLGARARRAFKLITPHHSGRLIA